MSNSELDLLIDKINHGLNINSLPYDVKDLVLKRVAERTFRRDYDEDWTWEENESEDIF